MKYQILLFLFLSTYLLTSCNKKQKKYNKFLVTADSLYKAKEYQKSKTYYKYMLDLKKGDTYATNKIRKVDALLKFAVEEADYIKIIEKADSLFNIKAYDESERAYSDALLIKSDARYPNEKLTQLSMLLDGDSIGDYHIIVGSFSIKENALRLQEQLLNDNRKSIIISRQNGKFNAVTCTSYPDIHDAYNHLREMRNLYHKEAWIIKK